LQTNSRQSTLIEILQPIVESMGYEFWSLELVQSRGHSLLRIYIELEDRHITVDDCASVSRRLSDKLDEIDLISEDYHLEVSSPGMDRPLVKASHFARAIGEEVRLETHLPVDGRKRYRCVLTHAEGDTLQFSFERKTLSVRVHEIANAVVIPDFSKPRVRRKNDPLPGNESVASEGSELDADDAAENDPN
jgi:ribosome maturation factor RimP